MNHTHSINLTPPRYSDHTHSFTNFPVYVDRDVPRGTVYGMNNAIYANPVDINSILQQPTKAPMSTIDKIKQERKEKREREELEVKFEAWEAAIGGADEGDVYAFAWKPQDKVYRYAAIYTDKRWYLTGSESRAFASEEFIAWLIEKEVRVDDFVFMEPTG